MSRKNPSQLKHLLLNVDAIILEHPVCVCIFLSHMYEKAYISDAAKLILIVKRTDDYDTLHKKYKRVHIFSNCNIFRL